MNKKIIFVLLIIAVLTISAFVVIKNRTDSEYLTTEIYSMNTVIQINISGKDKKDATDAVTQEINFLNQKFDDFSPQSDVSKINDNAGKNAVEVDNVTIEIISKALECYKETDGAFNISVAPLSKLWGFKGNELRVPLESEIKQTINLVNINDLIIEGNKVMLRKTGEAIDLGGIAKGYTLDKIKEILPKYNLKSAIINMGGNILTYGISNKGNWLIGIKNPREDGVVGKITIKGSKFISTSGDYEKYFIENGKRYCHIINPSTGLPSDKIVSVTVVSDKGYLGDAFSTAFFVLGKEKSLELANKSGVEIIGFDKNLNPFFTDGIKNEVNIEKGG
ncbi:MAG: thiamine biosynthesis protein ApbE [Caldiserica bacterium CG02_land_8_20_14_3_00_36_38]|nr:FAD:protein FMN transferase [Caldisericota bacterium]PIV55493.1 MAG: thiamine biosynthesis protein ApbE [Caldiserica bacterium CG02_land_8_20_14_3_00_36_38]